MSASASGCVPEGVGYARERVAGIDDILRHVEDVPRELLESLRDYNTMGVTGGR